MASSPSIPTRPHNPVQHSDIAAAQLRASLRFLAFVIAAFAIVALLSMSGAYSRDDGRYAQSPLKDWFNSLTNKHRVPCCSVADGVTIKDADWDIQNGSYRVFLEGQWLVVPDDAVITEPNRFGSAVVWPIKDPSGKTIVRCFIAGTLT